MNVPPQLAEKCRRLRRLTGRREWFLRLGKSFSEGWVNRGQVLYLFVKKDGNKKKTIRCGKVTCDH